MTEAQAKFVELEKKKKEIKKFFEELDEAILAVAQEIGIDGFFQDVEGTVYQVVKPKGTFMPYKDVGYLRTRRIDETRGDLSAKAAKEAGFVLPDRR